MKLRPYIVRAQVICQSIDEDGRIDGHQTVSAGNGEPFEIVLRLADGSPNEEAFNEFMQLLDAQLTLRTIADAEARAMVDQERARARVTGGANGDGVTA